MPRIEVAEQAGVGLDGTARPSEDRVVVLPHAVVLLDGATAIRPGARGGGWYAERLSLEIGRRLTAQPTADLAELLAAAIAAVAEAHGLVPGEAPSSTVAIARWTADVVDALVLADSPVVAFTRDGQTLPLVDDRVATLPRPGGYRARLRSGAGYGSDHVAAVRSSAGQVGTLRNREGGFWVAEADPSAAHHAFRASWPRAELATVLLASDGVACGVDDYHVFPDWAAVRDLAAASGAKAVLDRVRSAELDDPNGQRWPRPKVHDDQALALVHFAPTAS